MDQEKYRKIISGRTKGPAVSFARLVLRFAAAGYSLITAVRNRLFDCGIFKTNKAALPIISIGNITTGGTGKTPLVIWFANKIDKKCAVLTRGYKTGNRMTDEPELIKQSCPNAKVIINPDRTQGAKTAVENCSEICIIDDGFQHRRLYRDLDIVAIDATEPFGFGRILPAGLLREDIKGLKRADAIIITKTELVDKEKIVEIKEKIISFNLDAPIAETIYNIKNIRTKDENINIKDIKDKKILAFCGIGNPDAFFRTLEQTGCKIVKKEIFDDHHDYSHNDIEKIAKETRNIADMALTTQKDWVKVRERISDIDTIFARLEIEVQFVCGEDKITELIEKTIAGTM